MEVQMEDGGAGRKRGAQRSASYRLTEEQRGALRGLSEPITIARAAEILGQSESSLYNAIDAGRLRAVPYRWNERTMWKLVGEEIIAWAESRPARKKRKE